MQIAADVTAPQSIPATTTLADLSPAVQPEFSQYKIIRRNGAVVGFEPGKISVAVTKAFLAVEGGQSAASARIRELVAALTGAVVSALVRRQPAGGTFHIEDVQDQVELALMRSGEHEAARVAACIRNAHQFQITGDVLIVGGLAVNSHIEAGGLSSFINFHRRNPIDDPKHPQGETQRPNRRE